MVLGITLAFVAQLCQAVSADVWVYMAVAVPLRTVARSTHHFNLTHKPHSRFTHTISLHPLHASFTFVSPLPPPPTARSCFTRVALKAMFAVAVPDDRMQLALSSLDVIESVCGLLGPTIGERGRGGRGGGERCYTDP